ncbi:MAG: YibE/F family protein [Candidatus Ancillula sp.]|nr:YibE/F family protein [Candidatus Ancillula sp.]
MRKFSNLPRAKQIVVFILVVYFAFTVFCAVLFFSGNTTALHQNKNFNNLMSGKVVEETNKDNMVTVQISSGEEKDKNVTVQCDSKYIKLLKSGDKVLVNKLSSEQLGNSGPESQYVFYGFDRSGSMIFLVFVYVLVIVLVAGFKGLRALLGLVFGLLVILLFTIPALFAGSNTLLIGLVSSSLIMFVVLYIVHGFNMKTSVALLGTILGLLFTSLFGTLVLRITHITGYDSDESLQLVQNFPSISLSAIISCGIIISALGVLNDVTITQSSIVEELKSLNPKITSAQLFLRAMRVGKDHIASTIYTIAFAYIGSALPIIMWIYTFSDPVFVKITSETMITDVVSIFISGIGLVLSIPLTTLVAAYTATTSNAVKADVVL